MGERLSTGIKGLDGMIEGGLKRKSISMVVGEPGSGKSTFAVHFLEAGVKAGEKTLYISIEEKKEKFFDNMARFGFDLKKLDESGSLIFHKASTQELRTLLDMNMTSFEQYLEAGDVKRIVLDSITALMLAYNNETSQRTAAMALFDFLSNYDVTTLITSESEEDHGRLGVEYLVDGIIRMYSRRVSQERVRTIEILKMRGTEHSKQEMVYRLGDGGLILYPEEKILI